MPLYIPPIANITF